MTTSDASVSDPQTILRALRRAVHKALDRKRRLQHYMVVWADDRPQCIGPDAPRDATSPAPQQLRP